MGAHSSPYDVRFAGTYFLARLERRPSLPVVGPRHLEAARGSLHAFDAELVAEAGSGSKVFDKLGDSSHERGLLIHRQRIEVLAEARQPSERRQR